jgi:hypothetical protein
LQAEPLGEAAVYTLRHKPYEIKAFIPWRPEPSAGKGFIGWKVQP